MSRRAGAVTTLEPGMLGISLRDAGDGKSMAVIGVNGGSPAARRDCKKGTKCSRSTTDSSNRRKN